MHDGSDARSDQADQLTGAADELGFDEYRTAVADAVLSLDVHTERPAEFRGSLVAGVTGDIHIIDVRADEHAVHRTPALITRAPRRYFKFTLMEHGTGMIVQDGRQSLLHAGDMAIYDTGRPYSLLFDEAVRMSVVMFPKDLLGIPAETVAKVTAVCLDGSHGVGAAVRPYLSALARQVTEVESHVARRLFRSAIDMVETLLEANLRRIPTHGANEELMRSILDYIDDNLASAELNPAQIASAHFISVRHLYGLFSDQGATVSNVIRARRLERCYDELVSPLHAGRSVLAIAVRNGFVDAAHFSRTFRAHFGVPPSSIRPAHP